MESNFTPKEQAAYDRYIAKAEEVWENENQSVGIYVEQLAKAYPNKTALFSRINHGHGKNLTKKQMYSLIFF
ncbi:hypothetical protein ES705_47105 [subsurface metagenome]